MASSQLQFKVCINRPTSETELQCFHISSGSGSLFPSLWSLAPFSCKENKEMKGWCKTATKENKNNLKGSAKKKKKSFYSSVLAL